MEPVAGADSDAPQQQLKKDPELVTQAREALKAQGSSPESQVDVVATSLDAAGSATLLAAPSVHAGPPPAEEASVRPEVRVDPEQGEVIFDDMRNALLQQSLEQQHPQLTDAELQDHWQSLPVVGEAEEALADEDTSVQGACAAAMRPPCGLDGPVRITSVSCRAANALGAAANAFWLDGAVVLEDAIPEAVCDDFYSDVLARLSMGHLHTALRSGGVAGSRLNWRGDASLQHLYLPILQHALLRDLLIKLVGWHRWIKLTGDVVFPHCDEDQELHSDWGSCMPLHSPPQWEAWSCKHAWTPPTIVVSLVLETQTLVKAPLRLLNWSSMASLRSRWPPTSLCQSVRDSVCVGVPKGALIVRDVRVWHGGTRMQPGCAGLPRILPNVQCVSDAYVKEFRSNWERADYDGPQEPRRDCAPSLFEALPTEFQNHCHYLVPDSCTRRQR